MSDNDFDPVALIKAAQAFGEVVSHAKRVAENLPKPAKKPDAPKPPEAPTQAETTTVANKATSTAATVGNRNDILVPINRTDPRALENILTSRPDKTPAQMARDIGNYIRSGRIDSSDADAYAPTTATEVAELRAKLKIAESNVQRMGQERADAVNSHREYVIKSQAELAKLNKQLAEIDDGTPTETDELIAAELAELRSIVNAVRRVIGN